MRDSSSNFRVIGGGIVMLLAMDAIPVVAADQVCYTTLDGFWQCTQRLSLGARIAIAVGVSILLSVLISLCLCFGMRRRKSRQQEQQEAIASVYQIEPSQIEGPPTTYVTSFDARSPSGYPLPPSAAHPYSSRSPNPPTSFPETPDGYPHTPDADLLSANPAYPQAAQSAGAIRSPRVRFQSAEKRYSGKFSVKAPQTAPVNPAFSGPGAYPFPGYSYSPGATQQPYTAYSNRFPRPLYTGQPVQKVDIQNQKRNEIV